MLLILLALATLFVAYATGANANFKGVASLLGSGTTSYRTAINWGSATTLAGSVAAMFLVNGMIQNFSGKGLVPDALTANPLFLLAVALGAGLTVTLAVLLGFPVSTTHGLAGALVGVGLANDPHTVNFAKLWEAFLRPLLLSPLLAILAGIVCYFILRCLRLAPDHRTKTLDALHFLSAGAASFARGLNDTPKMAALLAATSLLNGRPGMLAIGVVMFFGGVLSARKVAHTLAHKVTDMNPGQGFSANLATALLVTTASFNALPVSTTHVAVGSLLGIGVATRQAKWRTVIPILLSWVITLPCAALLGALVFKLSQLIA
ncbi:MAG: cysP [Verrucomicrobiaceae bacterium]|nr:cysP [Verrucomicrobiaceae bacterium]